MPQKSKKNKSPLANKKLIVFDMDGTLTPSKAPMRSDMVKFLTLLLKNKSVAVIGGGSYKQFQRQFIAKAKFPKSLLPRLSLFPVCSTAFYHYANGWKKVYAKNFSSVQKKKIFAAFRKTFQKNHYNHPQKIYGKVIEDRKSQITFSAVGQDAVEILGVKKGLKVKERWNKHSDVRLELMKSLKKLLPEFTVRMGGLTSIDITKQGIDKAYGLRQIEKNLRVPIRDMLFVGDAIYPGGNDYAVIKTGVDYIKVKGPEETKKIIRRLISFS